MFYINNVGWNLKIVPSYFYKLKRNSVYTLGATDCKDKCIYISDTISGDLFKNVLYHELTHATIYSYHLSVDKDTEEKIADFISKYGYELFKNANNVFRYYNKKKSNQYYFEL